MEIDYKEVKIVKKRKGYSYEYYTYYIKVKVPVLIFFYKWVTIYSYSKYETDIFPESFKEELIINISRL